MPTSALRRRRILPLRVFIRLLRLGNWARAAGFAAILMSALICSFVWVTSYPPLPGFGIQGQHYDCRSNEERSGTTNKKSDSQASTATIKADTAGDEESQACRNERERLEKAANERGAAVATWVLAYATCFLVLATTALWIFTGLLWSTTSRAVVDSEKAAKAAETSATIAARQLELSHRPWIPPNIVPGGEIAFSDDKMTIPLIIIAKNIGTSPAFNVSTECQGGVVPLNDGKHEHRDDPTAHNQLKAADSLLATVKERAARQIVGMTLFPSEQTSFTTAVTLSMEDVRKEMTVPPSQNGIAPAIFGSVVYQSIAGDFYESGFALVAAQATENKIPGGPPIAYYGINPDKGNVQAGYWTLLRHPGASGRTT
jgi:hypothetical protein